ncbi:MliC family protein [Pseudoalteromonas shioyasakiensis]|uniref:MliC family protein n=1 Tax=Pseudoalteromonas shioyasakiensis TaxID=1190813 RepID=UPI00211980F5|nr:MliC family protein [Pseudoalteromonas shioyasakiensis]MCQ8879599.1 MliC family protein [Pseudoalteromonas shioyasakiensis]
MYKATFLAMSLLTLAACSEQAKSDVYSCDNQQAATITSTTDENAVLDYNQQQYQLVKQQSASGVKYTNDDVLFWTKGNEAMLIVDGNKHHCEIQ